MHCQYKPPPPRRRPRARRSDVNTARRGDGRDRAGLTPRAAAGSRAGVRQAAPQGRRTGPPRVKPCSPFYLADGAWYTISVFLLFLYHDGRLSCLSCIFFVSFRLFRRACLVPTPFPLGCRHLALLSRSSPYFRLCRSLLVPVSMVPPAGLSGGPTALCFLFPL
jgi:hypothetical protein